MKIEVNGTFEDRVQTSFDQCIQSLQDAGKSGCNSLTLSIPLEVSGTVRRQLEDTVANLRFKTLLNGCLSETYNGHRHYHATLTA